MIFAQANPVPKKKENILGFSGEKGLTRTIRSI
jgi:hypothetical protein